MSLPFTPVAVRVERPKKGTDPYSTGVTHTDVGTFPGQVSAPTGTDLRVGGDQQRIDAVLHLDLCADLAHADRVCVEGDTWEVVWVQTRPGHTTGLGHTRAGLVRVEGASNG